MLNYIGIDPGSKGAIAIIREGGAGISITPVLIGGKDLDLAEIAKWLQAELSMNNSKWRTQTIACIEKAHAMPGQGVSSMFSFGFTTGALHGILATLGISYNVVAPQTWKKVILVDTTKDKVAAVDYCRKAYPYVSLLQTPRCKKAHDGMADALCIATYCRLKYK